ncbi:4'-phosphopantetheinyl transferase superfamily protein [Endozoicomonas sp. GU-1]|uniref:4'-phosphopantetheinyl transferase family protein n=1 Tax=Endozoicomonas sp. GU-1 TaxID=3009078 RepID=UPI0022B5B4EA|nr:4'-phosphopantetheinyl transferase superfamily protein [Endozoicomonas sp. GU-1]WBA83550.1 4'-phosphopantetheinyl transferase superfamily protein [Endozoicomonas sp. GU-1]WBA86482.1 4'-phosphopantetheinyl transferase superfamily protein [Endozoicomonas sp. GU-1]
MIDALSENKNCHGLKDVDQQIPWPHLMKQNMCFTSGRFDQSIVCEATIASLTQSLPESYFSSVKSRRAEYLAGRMCAADAINRLLGCWLTPGSSISGAPIWPEGVVGSLSHSDHDVASVVMSAYGQLKGIGLDLEQIVPYDQIDALMDLVLLPDERKRFVVKELSRWLQRINTSMVFSLKESLFKALYPLVGKLFYFDAAEVLNCTLGGLAYLQVIDNLSPSYGHGFQACGYSCLHRGNILTIVYV